MAEDKKFEWALPKGTILNGGTYPYEVVSCLGHGGFGITYKVKARVSLNNIKVDVFFALKEYFPTGCWRGDDRTTVLYSRALEDDMKSGLSDFITEGNRLQKICKVNPNIVNVNEVFIDNGTAYFVMEYLSGGDLRELVRQNGGGLSEATMLSVLNPIAAAIESVHETRILHLDIKPENIVMRKGEDGAPNVPVLIDFGIAVHFDAQGKPTTTRPTKGATPGYSPAEQFAGVKRFDPRLDIYALSATCYYMITGKDPQSAFEIEESELVDDLSSKVSDRTRDAIIHGMARMPNHRPSSIAAFLKGFKESNALAVGTIIHGDLLNYMVMAVIDETPSYVHYRTSLASGDDQIGDIGTSTRNTSRTIYDLYEQLVDGKRIAAGSDGTEQHWDLPALRKAHYGFRDYGYQTSKTGGISSEYFSVDGVQYLSLCDGYKAPSKERKPLINWQKVKRPLTILATVIVLSALVALAVWGVAKLLNSGKGAKDVASSASSDVSIEMVTSDSTMVEPDAVENPAVEEEQSSSVEPAPVETVAKPDDAVKPTTETNAQNETKKKEPERKTTEENKNEDKLKKVIKETPPTTTTQPIDNRTPDQKAIDAAAKRDYATLKQLARSGVEKARVICENRGISW